MLRAPLVHRLQLDEHLEVRRQRRIGAVFGTAELRQELGDLGKIAPHQLLDLRRELAALGERDRRGQRVRDVERAFVELRQELGAEARREHDAGETSAHRRDEHGERVAHRVEQHRIVAARRATRSTGDSLHRLVAAQREERERRHEREADDHRAEQRADNGVRHRREDAALDALEREDRQVRGDDDQQREQRRARDLARGVEDDRRAIAPRDIFW